VRFSRSSADRADPPVPGPLRGFVSPLLVNHFFELIGDRLARTLDHLAHERVDDHADNRARQLWGEPTQFGDNSKGLSGTLTVRAAPSQDAPLRSLSVASLGCVRRHLHGFRSG
jgi:hypothetical protein